MYAHKFGDFNFDFGEFRGGHSDYVVLCFENACEFVCFVRVLIVFFLRTMLWFNKTKRKIHSNFTDT